MLYLINIEWSKFKKHRTFRTLVFLYLLFLPALLLIPSSLPGVETQLGELNSFYMFPNIFKYGGYMASWLIYIIIGFLGVILITTDIQNKTLRQNIISGLSRSQFFVGKVGFALCLAFFFVLYFLVIAMILGFLNTETIYLSKVMEGRPIIAGLFLQALAYVSAGLLIGLLVKRTGLALFLFFAYPLIEVFLRYGLHNKYIGETGLKFYPFNVFEDMVPIPFAKMVSSMTDGIELLLAPSVAMLVGGIYILVLLAITYFKLSKSDL